MHTEATRDRLEILSQFFTVLFGKVIIMRFAAVDSSAFALKIEEGTDPWLL